MPTVNLVGGWLGMLAGVLSGAIFGLMFHRDDWMGGYASYRRRLTRLGHISFFGLGFLNLIFAATASQLHPSRRISLRRLVGTSSSAPSPCPRVASSPHGANPCAISFPFPSSAVATGILAILIGWWHR